LGSLRSTIRPLRRLAPNDLSRTGFELVWEAVSARCARWQRKYVKKPIELMLRPAARALRPEGLLVFERLVRSEVALHRHLAASRRAASTRMSAVRRAKAAMIDRDSAEKRLPGFVAAAA
jgi:hypothetical protein